MGERSKECSENAIAGEDPLLFMPCMSHANRRAHTYIFNSNVLLQPITLGSHYWSCECYCCCLGCVTVDYVVAVFVDDAAVFVNISFLCRY